MRRRIALLLVIACLIGRGGVRASSDEALRLLGAMEEITSVLSDVNTGRLTAADGAERAALIRDDTVGDVWDYSPECLPIALYTSTVMDMTAEMLLAAADDEWSASQGWGLVVLALFLYPSNADGRFGEVLAGCSTGM